MEEYKDSDGQVLKINYYSNSIKNDTKLYFDSKNQYHRLDGPAIEFNDGHYRWLRNNLFHRIGGPAIFDWNNEWYINGKQVEIYYICG